MLNDEFPDVKSFKFTPISSENRLKYFSLFSLDIDYDPSQKNLDAFDALLLDSLETTESAILAYQQIGAILTLVT